MKTICAVLLSVLLCACLSIPTGCVTHTRGPDVTVNVPVQRPTFPDGSPLTIRLNSDILNQSFGFVAQSVLATKSHGLLQTQCSPIFALSMRYKVLNEGGRVYSCTYTVLDQWGNDLMRRQLPPKVVGPGNDSVDALAAHYASCDVINDLYSQTDELNRIVSLALKRSEALRQTAENGAPKGIVEGVDPTTQVHFVYNGDLSNGLPHGNGTMIWDNGDRYVGEFNSGTAYGQGLMKRGQWDTQEYRGKFVDGQITEGSATLIHPGRPYLDCTFTGKFKDSLPEGQGRMIFHSHQRSNGKTVEGTFKRGVLQGEAKITYPSGATLVINHVNGVRNGTGVHTAADGTTAGWTYHNGSFVESESNGVYNKEAANAPKDNLISTALKLQGLASTIHRVTAKSSGRKFIGKGSPPLNSFDANNQPNAKYFKWAYGE